MRPGDTLHLGFMLNDRAKQLPAEHPVVMELYNPLGQMYARKTQTRGELGLYVFDFVTERMPHGCVECEGASGWGLFLEALTHRVHQAEPPEDRLIHAGEDLVAW